MEKISMDLGEELNRMELVETIRLLKPAVGRKGIIEEMGDILFCDEWASTYNDELCIIADLNGSTGIDGGLKAELLYRLVDRMQGDSIKFEVNEGEVVIKSGASSFGIPMKDTPSFKKLADGFRSISGKQWNPLSGKLLEAIYLCSFYASTDMTRSDMIGVSVDRKEVLSTDGYRITRCEVDKGMGSKFFIPTRAASCISGYKVDKYAVKDGWLCFAGKGIYFCARLLDYKFPADKIRSFFGDNSGVKGVDIPKYLAEVLDRALVLIEDDFLLDKEISLQVSKGKMVCSVEKKDAGWFREEIEFPDKKMSFSIGVNPIFLKEVLKHSSKFSLVSEEALLLYADGFEHMISLR